MENILFVATRDPAKRRANYALSKFDEMIEFSIRFMMSVHGQGRWPSSRASRGQARFVSNLTKDDIDWAYRIIIMDDTPPLFNEKDDYKNKIDHWEINERIPWYNQKKLIKDKVSSLLNEIN